MSHDGLNSVTLLRHLALLYLGLAQGTDDDLDASETQAIASRLRRWLPGKDPALIDHVLRDVSMAQKEEVDMSHVREAVEALGRHLDAEARATILQDLADVARADGVVLRAEEGFIRRVAERWDLDASVIQDVQDG